jgi:exodeoxyribonuclease V beta subunit
MLLQYEQTKLKRIYIKNKTMEYFDDDYKFAVEHEKKQKQTDSLNILYVAMTRAKRNLIIFKKSSNSSFDIIPPTKTGTWTNSKQNKQTNTNTKHIAFEHINYGKQNISKKSKPSVSSIDSINFGVATHYCLEMMSAFDTTSLHSAVQLTKSNFSHVMDDDKFESIYFLCDSLVKNKQFQEQIKNKVLYKEQTIVYNQEIKIIDLVATNDDSTAIFDYKTGKKKPEDMTQIRLYKQAMTDITKKNISAFVLYLHTSGVDIVEV